MGCLRMSDERRARRGLTLVELLVVIALIGLLVALLLPAVQMARESARRVQCTSHLKQLSLAFHHYHSVHGRFPAGSSRASLPAKVGWGWGATLLPYLEQQPLHDALGVGRESLHTIMATPSRRPLTQIRLEVFRCPSGGGPDLNDQRAFLNPIFADTQAALAHYVGVHGTRWVGGDDYLDNGMDPFGMLWPEGRTSLSDVPDGTSNTFLLGERRWSDMAAIWVGTRADTGKANFGMRQVLGLSDVQINVGAPYGERGFSSEHPGGSHFVFVDGHVQYISESIDFNNLDAAVPVLNPQTCRMGAYQRLVRRNDGMPVEW